MLTIPTQPVPSQTLQTQVDGHNVTINLYSKSPQGLFADVTADGETLATGILALNAVPIIAATYLLFGGNFVFIDTQGVSDPVYSGLGSRFQLVYLTASEYALAFQ